MNGKSLMFCVLVLAVKASHASAQCVMEWSSRFDSEVQSGQGINGVVAAMTVFDDGTGPALYAAGSFTSAGSTSANNIARWRNGWSPLGTGLTGGVTPEPGEGIVKALCVHNDGTGDALYAGGSFTNAGGTTATGVAKWDGTAWSVLPELTLGTVRAMVSYNGTLVVGGLLCVEANRNVVKLNSSGTAWQGIADNGLFLSPFGKCGEFEPAQQFSGVFALAVFDDGEGDQLFAGGYFNTNGSDTVRSLAKLDTSGTPQWVEVAGNINSIAVVGGPKSCIPSECPSGLATVYCFAVRPLDGKTNALVFGGNFTHVNDCNQVNGVAELTPSGVFALGGGMTADSTTSECIVVGDVRALSWGNPGDGQALYAGGYFQYADGSQVNHIARYDGDTWSGVPGSVGFPTPMGSYIPPVYSLAFFDACNDQALYVGGVFESVAGVPSYSVAKWQCEIGCIADYNNNNVVDTQDYFDFLVDYFNLNADINRDCITDSQDNFDFLVAMFNGC